jgi:SAM-dependent methyltransferase
MHPESMVEMTRILDTWQGNQPAAVLDVGAYDVNGCYRPMVQGRGWAYLGLDVAAGPNVDVVSREPYCFPFPDGYFDIVISGSTLEHVEMPWLWMPEVARLVRPGGMLAVITHTRFGLHRFPVDCWRIMPDGMTVLFNLAGNLEKYDIRMYCETDISGVAYKVT